MNKFIISGLLALLLVPASVGAIGEVLTEDQSTTNNWCNANYPLTGLTRANDGLICDALTARENMRKVVQLLQQLLTLRQQLQVLLGNGNNPPPTATTTPTQPPQANNKIKVDLTGLKSNYNVGDDLVFSVVAKQKENGPSSLTFTSCQVAYTITLNTGAKPIIYNSLSAESCLQAASIVSLPKTWNLTNTSELAPGNYKLTAEVIGYGKSTEWHFNVKRPGDPTITLLSPSDNVVWATSTPKTVTWETSDVSATDKVDIIVIKPSQEHISLVGATGTANDGTQVVQLPANFLPAEYYLFVRLTRGGTVVNSKQVQVVVNAPTQSAAAPFITGVSPVKGKAGSALVISGTSFLSTNTVQVGTSTISNVALNDGKLTVVVPGLSPGNVSVRVSNTNGTSNSVNYEVEQYSQPNPVSTEITVNSPDANNEEWTMGTSKTIKWTSVPLASAGGAALVNLRLINQETNAVSDIKLQVPNTGTYLWSAGRLNNGTLATAGKYKIRICPVGNGNCQRGDNNVKLISSTTTTDPNAKTSFSGTSELAATASVLQGLINQLNSLLRSR